MTTKNLVNIKQAAKLLGISRQRMYAIAKDTPFPKPKVEADHYKLFEFGDLVKWRERGFKRSRPAK